MRYYVGIDGGGTKTLFKCADEKLNEIKTLSFPSCHVLQVEQNQAIEILKNGISQIFDGLPDNDIEICICAGLAGYGNDQSIRKRIEMIASEAFQGKPFILYNDAQIALAGALNNEDGILVIAGTGSIALSKYQGQIYRSGGWGYMLGDEGSAYWIAKQLLEEYTMQCDGRSPKTQVVKALKQYCNLKDDYDIISYISNILGNERDKIASLAKIAFELAENKDPASLRIYDQAGYHIASLINALATNVDQVYKASYIGGVFNAGNIILDPIQNNLKKNIELCKPYNDPAYGAILLAKEMFDHK